MFNFHSNSERTLAGPGYITLNALRVCNIIVLLTVAAASWVMLIMTVKTNSFFFFDGVSHFITSSISLFLIVSELTLFPKYFERSWPLLSPESGFVFLGMAMMVLGFNILGNMNKSATSVENLGLPLWRLVLSSGILSSLFGLFNMIATFVFCDSKQGITGRQVRSHGAIAPKDSSPTSKTKTFSFTSHTTGRAPTPLPQYNNTSMQEDRRKSKFGFKFPIKTSNLSISKPIVADNNPEQLSGWGSRSSPVVANLQRPPTALHPAFTPPQSSSSRYSEVHHLQRFSRGDVI